MKSIPRGIVSSLALAALLPCSPTHAGPVPGLGTWETTLQSRDINGDGKVDAFFDTVLNISWLANGNAGAGSVFDSTGYSTATDGKMKWADATAWAAGLDVYGTTGWRLPATRDTGGAGCNWSNAGGTDCGYNVQTISANGQTVYSEMAHMYYVTLGNLARCTPGHASCVLQGGAGVVNSAGFEDLEWGVYWSGSTVHNPSPAAWSFGFNDGVQDGHTVPLEFYAWAVHDGDVGGAVPEPASLALVLLALGLAAHAQRRPAA